MFELGAVKTGNRADGISKLVSSWLVRSVIESI